MPIKLSVNTFGKKDVFGFDARDLVKNFASFTGRKERTDNQIDAMVASLLSEGQEQPFTYRKGFDGEPIPITGHTRILAAARITERRMKGFGGGSVEIQYGPKNPFIVYGMLRQCNDLEAVLHTFRENDDETRTPTNDVDKAYLIRTLSDSFGLKDGEIAAKLRKPASWVSKHRRLLDLDAQTQRQVARGDLKFDAGLAASRVAPSRRQEVIEKAKEDGGGKATAAGIKKAARDLDVATVGKQAKARSDAEWKTWLRVQMGFAASRMDQRLASLYKAILDWREGSIEDWELRDRFQESLYTAPPAHWHGDNRGRALLISALTLRRDGASGDDIQEYLRILNRVRSKPPIADEEIARVVEEALKQAPNGGIGIAI